VHGAGQPTFRPAGERGGGQADVIARILGILAPPQGGGFQLCDQEAVVLRFALHSPGSPVGSARMHREIPDEPRVRAVLPHDLFLHLRGEEPVAGHISIELSTIAERGERRFLARLNAGVSTPRN
jgi:hypothetical protein